MCLSPTDFTVTCRLDELLDLQFSRDPTLKNIVLDESQGDNGLLNKSHA